MFKIPVQLYNGDFAKVSVQGVEGTALETTDYKILDPASGVLILTGDKPMGEITVQIVNRHGELTGNTNFKVEIKSATEGVETGALNTAAITIQDTDHPLGALFGEWEFVAAFSSGGSLSYNSFSLEVSEYPNSNTKIIMDVPVMDNLYFGGNLKCYANVTNTEGVFTISIPIPQEIQMTVAFVESWEGYLTGDEKLTLDAIDSKYQPLGKPGSIDFIYNAEDDCYDYMQDFALLVDGEVFSGYDLSLTKVLYSNFGWWGYMAK